MYRIRYYNRITQGISQTSYCVKTYREAMEQCDHMRQCWGIDCNPEIIPCWGDIVETNEETS